MSVTFDAATRRFCPEFDADLLTACPEADDLAVNVSSSNAVVLCAALGIDLAAEGWCGSLPAQDFLGRILVALAVSPTDAGVPTHELPREPGQVRWIECGRREGYTQERLAQLRELADWAIAHDAEISFG
jgi:hypothetical protein